MVQSELQGEVHRFLWSLLELLALLEGRQALVGLQLSLGLLA